MKERQLTFIDMDENSLVVSLKPDRVQLSVVDSRPELEAGELRAFATALFTEYVGPPLATRLEAARARLLALRDPQVVTGAATAEAIDGALRALDEVAQAISSTRAASAPEPEPAPALAPPPPEPEPVRPTVPHGRVAYARLTRAVRGKRAQECGGGWTWGWRRHDSSSAAMAATGR